MNFRVSQMREDNSIRFTFRDPIESFADIPHSGRPLPKFALRAGGPRAIPAGAFFTDSPLPFSHYSISLVVHTAKGRKSCKQKENRRILTDGLSRREKEVSIYLTSREGPGAATSSPSLQEISQVRQREDAREGKVFFGFY